MGGCCSDQLLFRRRSSTAPWTAVPLFNFSRIQRSRSADCSSLLSLLQIYLSYSQQRRLPIFFFNQNVFFAKDHLTPIRFWSTQHALMGLWLIFLSNRSVLPSEFDVCRFTRGCGSSCPPGTMSSLHQLGWFFISLSFFLLSWPWISIFRSLSLQLLFWTAPLPRQSHYLFLPYFYY